MDAIILISAAHINHYLPNNHPDWKPVAHYFSKALSSLQLALSELRLEILTPSTFDSIISCSMLLNHYYWTYIEEPPTDISSMFEQTVTLSQSMKNIIIMSQDIATQGEWWRVLGYRPKENLERFLRERDSERNPFKDVFLHCLFCGQGSRDPESASADNLTAATRLNLVLRVILCTIPNIETSGYYSDISRFLFTWPSLCTKGFIQQVKDNNMTSLTILLCYYAAILRVCSRKTWFMMKKAMYMYKALRAQLEGRCERCMKPVLVLFDGFSIETDSQMSDR
jgi:hypothetical protein